MKHLIAIIVPLLAMLALAATGSTRAQEAGSEPAQDAPAEQSEDGLSDALEATDDVFIPSEEIQADTEISFPSDI